MANSETLRRALNTFLNNKPVTVSIAVDDDGQLDDPHMYTDPVVHDYPQFKELIDPIYDERIDEDLNGLGEYTFTRQGNIGLVKLFVPELNEYRDYKLSLQDCAAFMSAVRNFALFMDGDGEDL